MSAEQSRACLFDMLEDLNIPTVDKGRLSASRQLSNLSVRPNGIMLDAGTDSPNPVFHCWFAPRGRLIPYSGWCDEQPFAGAWGKRGGHCVKYQKTISGAARLFTEKERKNFQNPVAIHGKIGYNTSAWV
ncbi:MAG: hypothetical protein ACI3XG_03485 [Faecousia sp.]